METYPSDVTPEKIFSSLNNVSNCAQILQDLQTKDRDLNKNSSIS